MRSRLAAQSLAGAVLGLLIAGTTGCPPENFPNMADATLSEVNEVVESDFLTPEEKRQALFELGISPAGANALLDGVRLANQFGGSLTSAYQKVTEARFSELTPDEIQYWGDAVREADDNVSDTVSDAQAQATANFFTNESIDSADELSDFLGSPTTDLSSDVSEGLLRALFVDFDPAGVVDQLP
jgi:hypothetical protein